MPNANVHVPVGMMVGGASAYVMSPKDAPLVERLIETLGGVLAGSIGARIPDWIDPPADPNHRCIAHSVMTAVGLGAIGVTKAREWQVYFRDEATAFRQLWEQE